MKRVICGISSLIVLISSTVIAAAECQDIFLKANAIFIHATVECNRDYMDTPAGYYALAMSRQCGASLSEFTIKAIAQAAFEEFDSMAKRKGKRAACAWAGVIERAIEKDAAGVH